MNKRDLSQLLNVSRPTLDKYLNNYKNELEPFILRVNGRFIDFNEEGIEVLRNIAKSDKYKPSQETRSRELEERLNQISKELEISQTLLKEREELVNALKSSNEELKADKRNLQAENEILKAKNEKMGNHIIVKLLGWNKD